MFAEADLPGLVAWPWAWVGLTIVLEEGQRELWFESQLIRTLAMVSLLGFALLAAGQVFSKKPVIQLRILFQRAFGSVFLLSLAVGAVLYAVFYIIPQFLVGVHGYTAEQSGDVIMISGNPDPRNAWPCSRCWSGFSTCGSLWVSVWDCSPSAASLTSA